MITIYGIPNCDTVKKARRWLENEGIDYQFHDFKRQGIATEQINEWLKSVDVNLLVNKRSTTWKQLDDAAKKEAIEGDTAAIIVNYPTLVKRPVLAHGPLIEVGFKAERYDQLFK